jgi:hypothetical protein
MIFIYFDKVLVSNNITGTFQIFNSLNTLISVDVNI